MKRFSLTAALALATILAFSQIASARWGYYGGPYAVSVGGPYRAVPGPVPYSTILQPDAPATYVVGPFGHVHSVRTIDAYPTWYY
jgi:hypothetical protein